MKLNLINLKNNTELIKYQGDLKIILNYSEKLNRLTYLIKTEEKVINAGFSIIPEKEIINLINKYGESGWEKINYNIELWRENLWQ